MYKISRIVEATYRLANRSIINAINRSHFENLSWRKITILSLIQSERWLLLLLLLIQSLSVVHHKHIRVHALRGGVLDQPSNRKANSRYT